MKAFLFGAVLAIAGVAPAYADWLTTVEDDLFSDNKVATMIAATSPSWMIYAQCHGPDDVSLAYIEAGSPGDLKSSVPAGKMVVKADNGKRWESQSSVYPHNDGYVGFSFDDKADVVDVIREMGSANSKISVGLDLIVSNSPTTMNISARGSSRAVKQFLDACGLS